eukprot:scaffold31792_cov168-Amphora_coffeaeformis.AAC.14
MIAGFTQLPLLLLLCSWVCLERAHGFSLQTPTIKGKYRQQALVRNLVTADNTIQMIRSRIRCKTSLPFKPDDSVDLYGDKDEEEEEEESLPEQEGPDVAWMATFLANRLARAYIKSKLQSNADSEAETTAEVATSVKDVSDATPKVDESSSDGNDDEESKSIILPAVVEAKGSTSGSTTTAESSTDPAVKSEKVSRELLARRESDKSVVVAKEEEGKPQSEAPPTEVKEADKEVKPVVDKDDTTDVETAEVPSLMHEKEGDRNIGLKDAFVEVTDGVGEELWSGIPVIPQAISLEFGRPLQVVKDGIPPIRS